MEQSVQRTIVVSAVNVRKGGTLTIQRDCLQYLSELVKGGDYKVYALVHNKNLCYYDGIDYIEFPNTIKGWSKRLWCEYVTMKKMSKEIGPVYLWLSMHDTTPNVIAEKRAVYCQTSFPFYKWSYRDFYFDYKIALFAMFTRFAYRVNVHKNNYLISQQQWFRHGLSEMLSVPESQIVLCPPQRKVTEVVPEELNLDVPIFFYASTPDCHKNFETLCEASRLLEKELGKGKFKVVLTLSGDKNRYDRWLKKKWGNVDSIEFAGFMSKERLYGYYKQAAALVFPSKVETWGLPISEFMDVSDRPIILSDLPYAHETACGKNPVSFFSPTNANELKQRMKEVLDGNLSSFQSNKPTEALSPKASSWKELFEILLNK
ncbi:MAG: glycosyltransferase family 4 protein [Bacteroidales bacterium]|nr:glycosyltransferase family 4 protein [Bacteroidales bacterium]